MKISKFIKLLQDIKTDEGDINVALSTDEEGNAFYEADPTFALDEFDGKEYVIIYPTNGALTECNQI